MKTKKDKGQGPASNYFLERLLSMIIIVVFILAIVTGILSFIRLNTIIDKAKTGIRPDRSLLLAKEISTLLFEAENSVKSYSLTRREEDMLNFYQVMDETGVQMQELKRISYNDEDLLRMIDSLDQLLTKKFDILDRLLVSQNESLVNEVMHEVMHHIRQQENVVKPLSSEQDTVKIIKVDTVEEEIKEKESFFRRLFGKKNKSEKDNTDSVPDVILPKKEEKATLAVDEVSRQVEKIQRQALQDETKRKKEELALFQADKLVMQKIRLLMLELERREDEKLRQNVKEAEDKAAEVKSIILTYGLAALVLLLLVAVSIYTYIRRNNEYRSVLRKAKADAEALAKQKEGFLANMSHEIKTPMNIISGYLDLIIDGQLEENQREKIGIVRKSSNHLIQLLNNLLDLSKMQAGKLVMIKSDFEPREVIRDIGQWFTPAAREKGIELVTYVDPEFPVWVNGDPVRLRQILFNLTGNAVKFTSSGKISIRLTLIGQTAGKIWSTLEVADTGIGISLQDQKRIFEQFEQVHTTGSLSAEGSGLGLAITLQLVNLMDGKIELDSEPGNGSTFRLTIPFDLIDSNNSDNTPSDEMKWPLLKGLRILVVDDEAYNRKLARIILEKHHCIVSEAASGEEAVEKSSEAGADLILMDIRMDGMGGQEAARVIRQQFTESSNRLAIIALSAEISDEDYKNLKNNGIDEFLAKPIEEEILVRTIYRIMHHVSSNQGNIENDAAYDLTPLINISRESDTFLSEMVTLFIDNTADGLMQIEQHLKRQEWDKAAEVAHKISGPCRHLKAMSLLKYLKDLERSLKENKPSLKAQEILKLAMIEFESIQNDISSKFRIGNKGSHE